MHCGNDNVAIYTNGNGNEILSILTQLLVSVCIQHYVVCNHYSNNVLY